jgi:uncharacterized C2H2 Zn-finger protein
MICPRCDDDRAGKIFEAPEDDSWELYRCPRCYFIWRNTEEEEVTNPELYDARFKLSEKKIAAMDPKPPIPAIKKNRTRPKK